MERQLPSTSANRRSSTIEYIERDSDSDTSSSTSDDNNNYYVPKRKLFPRKRRQKIATDNKINPNKHRYKKISSKTLLAATEGSSEWETDIDEVSEEEIDTDECTKSKGSSDTDQSQYFEKLFDPSNFKYVELKTKVLENYCKRHFQQPREKFKKSSRNYELGGDLDGIEVPAAMRGFGSFDKDPLNMNYIRDTIDNGKLSISQKYRIFGVEEDPHEELAPEENSCWQWFLYKVNRLIFSQWPGERILRPLLQKWYESEEKRKRQ